jgi:hypothetical protein
MPHNTVAPPLHKIFGQVCLASLAGAEEQRGGMGARPEPRSSSGRVADRGGRSRGTVNVSLLTAGDVCSVGRRVCSVRLRVCSVRTRVCSIGTHGCAVAAHGCREALSQPGFLLSPPSDSAAAPSPTGASAAGAATRFRVGAKIARVAIGSS